MYIFGNDFCEENEEVLGKNMSYALRLEERLWLLSRSDLLRPCIFSFIKILVTFKF